MKFVLCNTSTFDYDILYIDYNQIFKKFNVIKINNNLSLIEFDSIEKLNYFLDYLKENFECGVVIGEEYFSEKLNYYAMEIYDGLRE